MGHKPQSPPANPRNEKHLKNAAILAMFHFFDMLLRIARLWPAGC
jgi:hypothetical protein